MRKRKADEVVTLSADVEEWIKTELWEERAREVKTLVRVKEERGEEEEEGAQQFQPYLTPPLPVCCQLHVLPSTNTSYQQI